MSRYAYDYMLTPARPTGWRAALTNIVVFTTVMAVSAISGVVVTLELLAPSAPASVVPQVVAAVQAAPPAVRQIAAVAPSRAQLPAQQPATVAAAVADHQVPTVPPAVAAMQPPPAVVSESDLTFAKGYERRRAAELSAIAPNGKVIVAAVAKTKPRVKVYARRKAADDQRRIAAARGEAYGMFQRFDRPAQFDFTRHQALAFGEQRLVRPRSYSAPRPGPYGNSPNGFFGGLF